MAERTKIIDIPNRRSSHDIPTIKGGGIVFYFALILFFIFSQFDYPWFFAGITVVTLLSMIDDIRHVPFYYRMAAHFVAVTFLMHELSLFVGNEVWYIALVMIISSGIVNAYNFMDGINGMTGLYSLVALITFWWYNKMVDTFVDGRLILFIIVGVLVFLFYNLRTKARTFAGDVGAVSIAFIIIFFLMQLINLKQNVIFILFLSVYGVDTVLTIFIRIFNKENIFQAHRSHLYQILVHNGGMSHIRVSAYYAIAQGVINVLVISVADQRTSIQIAYALMILLVLAVNYTVLRIRYTRYITKEASN
ncbi:MAG TPA: UDP-GlcNAc--UDP-phosphate GlcNAc-1-phosphate transferase [Flavobacteriales bacterium]|jgi:UDP-GlcNAc:undecaprenyl-phosphate GlcNAc-1-phosphate transferase|nr:UDP-GlcNAc--UDP-phosphate GlcNAc-1-phosphate transferase [Flavobacteriales bacterium]